MVAVAGLTSVAAIGAGINLQTYQQQLTAYNQTFNQQNVLNQFLPQQQIDVSELKLRERLILVDWTTPALVRIDNLLFDEFNEVVDWLYRSADYSFIRESHCDITCSPTRFVLRIAFKNESDYVKLQLSFTHQIRRDECFM